ncbi:TetR/AcrR family transcriptional regulator [Roseibium sp.]|uniref:TetR/AcrR family transcriptional regulator n=1 Tax=Roseibium sp. TaxID=1936156 RepID=UPI003B52E76A
MPSDTKTRKPQARTALTRARILTAAATLSRTKALEDITAEAIAKEAGVAKGTLFAHFGDMDGLLSYLLLDHLRQLREAADLDDMTSKDDLADPVGALVKRMMALIAVITESQTMLRVFLENIGATKGHCAPEFIEQLDVLDQKLLAFMEMWRGSPDIRPALRDDRSLEELLDGLIAFLIHSAILYRSHQIQDLNIIYDRLYKHTEAFLVTAPIS